MSQTRILIAGIGNIFFGDDGFGVEVVRALSDVSYPEHVEVVDFGIRGFDLALALTTGYSHCVMVDAMPGGKPPGTLTLIEPDPDDYQYPQTQPLLQAHGLHPLLVLQLANQLGELCPWIRLVGCEPAVLGSEEEPIMGLTDVVRASVPEAIRMIQSLVNPLCDSAP